MNSDRKPSCRTNVLILFNKNLKNKTKLIKENSIPPWLAGPLEHVHMENFHLTYFYNSFLNCQLKLVVHEEPIALQAMFSSAGSVEDCSSLERFLVSYIELQAMM